MTMNDDPDQKGFDAWLSDPAAQKAYRDYRKDSEESDRRIDGVLDRLRGVEGLPQDLLWDIEIELRAYQRLRIEAKRRQISDAKSDDVDRRRELVHKLAAEIRASRPTLSARSLATLIHARLKADPSLSPSEVLGVEAIRKILRDQRKSG